MHRSLLNKNRTPAGGQDLRVVTEVLKRFCLDLFRLPNSCAKLSGRAHSPKSVVRSLVYASKAKIALPAQLPMDRWSSVIGEEL